MLTLKNWGPSKSIRNWLCKNNRTILKHELTLPLINRLSQDNKEDYNVLNNNNNINSRSYQASLVAQAIFKMKSIAATLREYSHPFLTSPGSTSQTCNLSCTQECLLWGGTTPAMRYCTLGRLRLIFRSRGWTRRSRGIIAITRNLQEIRIINARSSYHKENPKTTIIFHHSN